MDRRSSSEVEMLPMMYGRVGKGGNIMVDDLSPEMPDSPLVFGVVSATIEGQPAGSLTLTFTNPRWIDGWVDGTLTQDEVNEIRWSFSTVWPDQRDVKIQVVSVSPQFQRQGVGSELIEQAKSQFPVEDGWTYSMTGTTDSGHALLDSVDVDVTGRPGQATEPESTDDWTQQIVDENVGYAQDWREAAYSPSAFGDVDHQEEELFSNVQYVEACPLGHSAIRGHAGTYCPTCNAAYFRDGDVREMAEEESEFWQERIDRRTSSYDPSAFGDRDIMPDEGQSFAEGLSSDTLTYDTSPCDTCGTESLVTHIDDVPDWERRTIECPNCETIKTWYSDGDHSEDEITHRIVEDTKHQIDLVNRRKKSAYDPSAFDDVDVPEGQGYFGVATDFACPECGDESLNYNMGVDQYGRCMNCGWVGSMWDAEKLPIMTDGERWTEEPEIERFKRNMFRMEGAYNPDAFGDDTSGVSMMQHQMVDRGFACPSCLRPVSHMEPTSRSHDSLLWKCPCGWEGNSMDFLTVEEAAPDRTAAYNPSAFGDDKGNPDQTGLGDQWGDIRYTTESCPNCGNDWGELHSDPDWHGNTVVCSACGEPTQVVPEQRQEAESDLSKLIDSDTLRSGAYNPSAFGDYEEDPDQGGLDDIEYRHYACPKCHSNDNQYRGMGPDGTVEHHRCDNPECRARLRRPKPAGPEADWQDDGPPYGKYPNRRTGAYNPAAFGDESKRPRDQSWLDVGFSHPCPECGAEALRYSKGAYTCGECGWTGKDTPPTERKWIEMLEYPNRRTGAYNPAAFGGDEPVDGQFSWDQRSDKRCPRCGSQAESMGLSGNCQNCGWEGDRSEIDWQPVLRPRSEPYDREEEEERSRRWREGSQRILAQGPPDPLGAPAHAGPGETKWDSGLCDTYALALIEKYSELRFGTAGYPTPGGWRPEHHFAHDDHYAYDVTGPRTLEQLHKDFPYVELDQDPADWCGPQGDNVSEGDWEEAQGILAQVTSAVVEDIVEAPPVPEDRVGGFFGAIPAVYDLSTGALYVGQADTGHADLYKSMGMEYEDDHLQIIVGKGGVSFNSYRVEDLGLGEEALDQIRMAVEPYRSVAVEGDELAMRESAKVSARTIEAMDNTYYHVAPESAAGEIEQHGLDYGRANIENPQLEERGNYLFDSLESAQRYRDLAADPAHFNEPYVVYEVDTSEIDLMPDPDAEYPDAVYAVDPIGPERLRLIGAGSTSISSPSVFGPIKPPQSSPSPHGRVASRPPSVAHFDTNVKPPSHITVAHQHPNVKSASPRTVSRGTLKPSTITHSRPTSSSSLSDVRDLAHSHTKVKDATHERIAHRRSDVKHGEADTLAHSQANVKPYVHSMGQSTSTPDWVCQGAVDLGTPRRSGPDRGKRNGTPHLPQSEPPFSHRNMGSTLTPMAGTPTSLREAGPSVKNNVGFWRETGYNPEAFGDEGDEADWQEFSFYGKRACPDCGTELSPVWDAHGGIIDELCRGCGWDEFRRFEQGKMDNKEQPIHKTKRSAYNPDAFGDTGAHNPDQMSMTLCPQCGLQAAKISFRDSSDPRAGCLNCLTETRLENGQTWDMNHHPHLQGFWMDAYIDQHMNIPDNLDMPRHIRNRLAAYNPEAFGDTKGRDYSQTQMTVCPNCGESDQTQVADGAFGGTACLSCDTFTSDGVVVPLEESDRKRWRKYIDGGGITSSYNPEAFGDDAVGDSQTFMMSYDLDLSHRLTKCRECGSDAIGVDYQGSIHVECPTCEVTYSYAHDGTKDSFPMSLTRPEAIGQAIEEIKEEKLNPPEEIDMDEMDDFVNNRMGSASSQGGNFERDRPFFGAYDPSAFGDDEIAPGQGQMRRKKICNHCVDWFWDRDECPRCGRELEDKGWTEHMPRHDWFLEALGDPDDPNAGWY